MMTPSPQGEGLKDVYSPHIALLVAKIKCILKWQICYENFL
jgi:hypothetical protein